MLQMKRETNKMSQPRKGGLRLGPARVDHLALFMQVAPYSTMHILGTTRFAGVKEAKEK